MKGWDEKEISDKNLMAPCGLYCGVCGIYIATRDDNHKFKEILGKLYGSDPAVTECRGCMQSEPAEKLYGYCTSCLIRDCVKQKGFYACHQCAEWPCALIQNFPLATGRRVMERTVPAWRSCVAEHGDDAGSVEWARKECERYHCPECGNPLFRGAKRCRQCNSDLADRLDGTI